MITWLTKKANNQQGNARGTDKLPDHSVLTIVNSEHDIACWLQPIR